MVSKRTTTTWKQNPDEQLKKFANRPMSSGAGFKVFDVSTQIPAFDKGSFLCALYHTESYFACQEESGRSTCCAER